MRRDGVRQTRMLALIAVTLLLGATLLGVVQSRGQSATGALGEPAPATYRAVGDGNPTSKRPQLGAPRDQLSPEEASYAIHLAVSDGSVSSSAGDVHGDPGPEVLQVDLPAESHGEHRIAVVHLHDYTADVGYQQIIDLTTGEVRSNTSPLLQGPISTDEAEVALRLAIDHSPALTFAQQFEAAQGAPLLSPDQVTAVAGVYRHDGSQTVTKKCGKHRCAQLMIQGPSGAYLAAWDFVVDLTTKRVIVLESRTDHHHAQRTVVVHEDCVRDELHGTHGPHVRHGCGA